MTTVNTAAKAIKTKPITGTRTAKPADKRGPKAGSAMANQSVKLAPEPKKSDIISECKNAQSGPPTVCIAAPGQPTIYVPQNRYIGTLVKLGAVGSSYKAFAAAWAEAKANPPAAKMARGVDAANSPHTAKAVSDARTAGAKHDPVSKALASKMQTPKAVPAKPAKADKSAPAAKAAPKADAKPVAARKYKATKKPLVAKPDSFRVYMVETIRAYAGTTAAKAAHAASGKFTHERLNFKWAHDSGYIVLADLA